LINNLYNKIKVKFFLTLLNFYYLFKLNKNEKKIVDKCDNYDFQTTQKNILRNNIDILNILKKNHILGDFVECGVYKGITLVFFQKYIEINRLENIKIYGFDTFEGIPEPSHKDIDIYGKSMKDMFEKHKINKVSSSWNNSSLEDDLFIVHTEYPRFILNVSNDEVHWLEDFDKEDEATLKAESHFLIEAAFDFYDAEMESLEQ